MLSLSFQVIMPLRDSVLMRIIYMSLDLRCVMENLFIRYGHLKMMEALKRM